MRRIAVIGSCGAGKSTLARQVGNVLGIAVLHLDRFYWKPGWVPTAREEWKDVQLELVSRPEWIIDGNYSSTVDLRLQAADTILFLDLPRTLCLWRAIKRRIMYRAMARPDMGEGCQERIDWEFLNWIWTFPQRERPTLLARLEQYRSSKTIIHLRSPRQVEAFLKAVSQNRSSHVCN